MDIDDIVLNIFYIYCWKYKPKRCQGGCNKKLPYDLNKCCMDHNLEKSKYPECKYSITNISYYMPDCHANKSNGFPNKKQLERINKSIEKYDFLKKESLNFEKRIKSKL